MKDFFREEEKRLKKIRNYRKEEKRLKKIRNYSKVNALFKVFVAGAKLLKKLTSPSNFQILKQAASRVISTLFLANPILLTFDQTRWIIFLFLLNKYTSLYCNSFFNNNNANNLF